MGFARFCIIISKL